MDEYAGNRHMSDILQYLEHLQHLHQIGKGVDMDTAIEASTP